MNRNVNSAIHISIFFTAQGVIFFKEKRLKIAEAFRKYKVYYQNTIAPTIASLFVAVRIVTKRGKKAQKKNAKNVFKTYCQNVLNNICAMEKKIHPPQENYTCDEPKNACVRGYHNGD